MKYFVFILMLISGVAYGQTTYYIRADSTRLQKVGGSNELIIENDTRDSLGVLVNIGKGRTAFQRGRANGDTLFLGRDTIIGGAGGAVSTQDVYAGIGLKQVNDSTLRADSVSRNQADSLGFARKIVGWGDSNTEFAGGYLEKLSIRSGWITHNEGISGQTASQIKNRMIAAPYFFPWSVIIWAGRNNPTTPSTTLSSIAQMVDSIKHNRYLILGVHNIVGEGIGTATHDSVVWLNNQLASIYGEHFLDVRTMLIASADGSAGDITAVAEDRTPPSLMYDNVHFNSTGHTLIANWIYDLRAHVLSGPQYMNKLMLANMVPRVAQSINGYTYTRATYNISNYLLFDSASNPVLRNQEYVWNGSAWVATQGYGLGRYSLRYNKGTFTQAFGPWSGYSNTGNFGAFFGYTSGQNNTGANSVGYGNNTLTNNTGSSATAIGHGALNANTGANSVGAGVGAGSNNIGANATLTGATAGQLNRGADLTANGYLSAQYNVGARVATMGGNSLLRNNWNNRTHVGYQDNSTIDYVDDAATNKTFTESSISSNNITITSHGFGSTGAVVSLKYTVLSGGPISIFTTGSIYTFTVVDANTLSYTGLSGATKPAGSYQLNKDVDRTNSSSVGYNARPDKANQVMLGNSSVTEVKTSGHIDAAASTYSSGGYDVLVRNQTSGDFEKMDTSTLFSAVRATIPGGGGSGPDTTGAFVTAVYRKTGSDSVFYVKGGVHTFAYKDSIGTGGGGGGVSSFSFWDTNNFVGTVTNSTTTPELQLSISGDLDNQLLYAYDGALLGVSIGSGLDFTGGVLSNVGPGSGTVESVATNTGTGITGGTITTTGTIAADTANVLATRLQVQHRIDSLAATVSGGSGNAYSDNILLMRSLGADIIAEAAGLTIETAVFAHTLVDNQIRLIPVYVRTGATATGVSLFMRTQGSYTADNNNKIGLYSYSGGTYTKVAECADDGNLWKATANSWIHKDFTTPYVTSSNTTYFIALVFNSNGAPATAPTIAAGTSLPSGNMVEFNFSSNAKLFSAVGSSNDLPSTIAATSLTSQAAMIYAALRD